MKRGHCTRIDCTKPLEPTGPWCAEHREDNRRLVLSTYRTVERARKDRMWRTGDEAWFADEVEKLGKEPL